MAPESLVVKEFNIQQVDPTAEAGDVYQTQHPRGVKAGIAAITGVLLLAAGCGVTVAEGHHGSDPQQVTGYDGDPISTGPCADIAQLGENLANVAAVPNTEAYLPALFTTDSEGNQTLVSTNEASETVRKYICGDSNVLAVFSAVQELWHNEQLPSPSLFTKIIELQSLYSTDTAAAEQAEEAVYPWLSTLVPTTSFAVTAGQATVISGIRTNGKLSSFTPQTVTSTETLSGFEIGFLQDNENLTKDQKALYEKLQQLVLIDENGYIVINDLIANTNSSTSQSTAAGSSPSSSTGGGSQTGSVSGGNGSGTSGYSSGGITTEGHPCVVGVTCTNGAPATSSAPSTTTQTTSPTAETYPPTVSTSTIPPAESTTTSTTYYYAPTTTTTTIPPTTTTLPGTCTSESTCKDGSAPPPPA